MLQHCNTVCSTAVRLKCRLNIVLYSQEADPIAPSERDITPNNILDPPQKKDENETIPKIPYSSPQAIWMRDQEEEERKFALQSTVPNFNSTRKSAGDRSQLQHPQSSPKTFVTADATAEFSKKEQAVPVKCPGEPKMQHTSTSLTSSALVPSASQNKTSTDHGDSAVSRSSSSTSTSSGSNSVPDELDLQRESRMNILEDNVHMNIRSNSAGTTSFNYPTTSQFQSSIIQVCNPHRSTALFDDKSPMLESLNDNFKTASLRNSSLKEEMKLKSSEKNDETESLTDSQIQESDTDTEVESVGEKSKQECRSVKDDIAKSKNESKLTKQEPKDGIFSFPDEGEVLISDQNEENVSTSCLNSSTNQATVIESDSKDIRNQIAASESTTNVPQKLHRRLPNQIEAKRSNTIDTQNRSSAPTNSFSLSTETTNKTHATVAQNSLQNHVDASSLAANVGESIQNEFSPSNDPDVAIHIHDNSQQSDNDAGNPLRQVMRTALTAGFWVVDTYNKYAKFLN